VLRCADVRTGALHRSDKKCAARSVNKGVLRLVFAKYEKFAYALGYIDKKTSILCLSVSSVSSQGVCLGFLSFPHAKKSRKASL